VAFVAVRGVGVAGAGLTMALLDGVMLVLVLRVARRHLARGAELREATFRLLGRFRQERVIG
jgi:hypothetical protein